MCLKNIYNYSFLDLKDAILFLQGLFFSLPFVCVYISIIFFASTLCMCDMCLTSFDGLNAVWSNNRAVPTHTNPKNHELASPRSVMATRLDQLVYNQQSLKVKSPTHYR